MMGDGPLDIIPARVRLRPTRHAPALVPVPFHTAKLDTFAPTLVPQAELESVMHLDQHCGLLEHVADESDDMEAGECFGISLIVSDKAAAACRPGKGSFDNPTSGEQNESALCLGQLDHLERYPFRGI